SSSSTTPPPASQVCSTPATSSRTLPFAKSYTRSSALSSSLSSRSWTIASLQVCSGSFISSSSCFSSSSLHLDDSPSARIAGYPSVPFSCSPPKSANYSSSLSSQNFSPTTASKWTSGAP